MSSIVYIPPAGGGSGTAQLKDTDGNDIGAPVSVPSGPVVDIVAPDGSVQPVDSIGAAIGSPVPVKSNGTANATIADSAVTVNGSAFASVKATQSLNVPVKQGGVAVGSKVGSEWIVPQEPTLFEMGYAADYLRFQITPKEAGIYTSWSSLGVSGTWTYRKGLTGAYAAPSGSVVLNAGDWIEVMRTINTADGVWTWVR